jgi:hypothetical protein
VTGFSYLEGDAHGECEVALRICLKNGIVHVSHDEGESCEDYAGQDLGVRDMTKALQKVMDRNQRKDPAAKTTAKSLEDLMCEMMKTAAQWDEL